MKNSAAPADILEYFQTIYSFNEKEWGESASDLARETLAFMQLQNLAYVPHVLELGCGDGRDALFFAKQGWQVTAVALSDEVERVLSEKAQQFHVADKIKILRSDFSSLVLPEKYDLIFSNYSLHFLPAHLRGTFFQQLMMATKEGGFHAILVMRDLNEELIGSVDGYQYFRSHELSDIYRSWKLIDSYDGYISDAHPGTPQHEHSVSTVFAQKPQNVKRRMLAICQVTGEAP